MESDWQGQNQSHRLHTACRQGVFLCCGALLLSAHSSAAEPHVASHFVPSAPDKFNILLQGVSIL